MGDERHGAVCNGEAAYDFQHLAHHYRCYGQTLAYKTMDFGTVATTRRWLQVSAVHRTTMTDIELVFRRGQISNGLFRVGLYHLQHMHGRFRDTLQHTT
jgi:hypothetical protein